MTLDSIRNSCDVLMCSHAVLLNLQVGEGRACWSLGNAHSAMGETESAYHYASRCVCVVMVKFIFMCEI